VQGAGVDDANAVEPFVASDVGMTVEDIIHVERVGGVFEPAFVTVKDGEAFSPQFDPGGYLSRYGDVHRFQIGAQMVEMVVGVPPNESEGAADQFIENALAADVAAMNDVRDSEVVEKSDDRTDG